MHVSYAKSPLSMRKPLSKRIAAANRATAVAMRPSFESRRCAIASATKVRSGGKEAAVMKCVCVFCGSNVGRDPPYLRAATPAGEAPARARVTGVYGGGQNGLMGAAARATLDL